MGNAWFNERPSTLSNLGLLKLHLDQSKLKHMNLAFFKAGKASKRGQQTQNCWKQILRFVKNIEGTQQTSTRGVWHVPLCCPITTALPTFSLVITDNTYAYPVFMSNTSPQFNTSLPHLVIVFIHLWFQSSHVYCICVCNSKLRTPN